MSTLLRMLVPYRSRIALAVGLGAAVVGSNMGLLAGAAYLIAAASVTHLMALLLVPIYTVRLLSAARGSARYAERLVSHRVTFDVLARLRVGLFDRLRAVGPAGLQARHSGDVLSRAVADIEQLQNAYLLFLSPITVAIIVSTGLVFILLAISPAIAWPVLAFLVAAGVALPIAIVLLCRNAGRELVMARADLDVHFVDSIQGNRDILTNDAVPRFLQQTASHARRMACAEMRLGLAAAGREGVTDLLANLAMLTALTLAIPLVTRHVISPLYVAVPALLTLAAFEAIRPLALAAESVSGVVAAGHRVFSIGRAEDRYVCAESQPVDVQPLRPPFALAFDGVTLRYAGSNRPSLDSVSFTVAAGAHVAVVGPSGAGKSSLLRLLTRSWQPTRGSIVIAGRDIRACSIHDLRSSLGVAAQDTYIFNDTIRSNLLLACSDASTADLEEALDAVDLLDMVRRLPDGLDTWVGEHGERLSGGERQRLSIARVLLQDAPIVLLDEVTANLDPLTERAIIDMLHRVTAGRTVLSISHRLIGMERMDEIIVLDRGQVVERGTHAALSASAGLYQRLLDVQDNMLAV